MPDTPLHPQGLGDNDTEDEEGGEKEGGEKEEADVAAVKLRCAEELLLKTHLGVRPRGYLRLCWDMIGYERIS